MKGLTYEATGILLGANGEQIHGTVSFDQGMFASEGWVAADPTDHRGDVCGAHDDAHRPIDSTTVPAEFFPWRFHPDEPLPSTPYDCPVV